MKGWQKKGERGVGADAHTPSLLFYGATAEPRAGVLDVAVALCTFVALVAGRTLQTYGTAWRR